LAPATYCGASVGDAAFGSPRTSNAPESRIEAS
jgi:hypothetical protein